MSKQLVYVLAVIPILFLLVFFVVPVVQMLQYSIYKFDPNKLVVKEFTIGNYTAIALDSFLRSITVRTFKVAALTTFASVVVSFPIAYWMRQARGTEKMLLSLIVLSPLMVSLVVLGYAWIVILAPHTGLLSALVRTLGGRQVSIMYSETAIVIGLVYTEMVFMVLSLHAALETIDERLLQAARVLGANPFQAFTRIVLPLSLPGIVSGSLLVFAAASSSFVIPHLLGGRGAPVLATYAYDMASYVLNWPSASAVGGVLVAVSAILMILYASWASSMETKLGSR